MFQKILAAFAAFMVTASVQAEMAPGKVVIYRADEASKTQRIKFNASIDSRSVGRLNYKNPVVKLVQPGSYTIATSLKGTEPLQIDVRPGATYYVYAGVTKMGQRVTPNLQVVEEQAAVAQQPALEQILQDPV